MNASPVDANDATGDETQTESTVENVTESENHSKELSGLSPEAAAETSKLFAAHSSRMGGGFMPDLTPKNLEEYNEEEVERLDRAMRDYQASAGSLLVNNAKSFYFYEQLNQTEKDIYDSMLMLAEDPTSTDHVVVLLTDDDVESDAFGEELQMAYHALLADHPELFWLNNGIKTDIGCGYCAGEAGYAYTVYFQFAEAYSDFEKDMQTFNDAVDSFMSGINLQQDDYKIAREIHDKLISLTVYDDEVYERNNGVDLAHTAYGALVANSRGGQNTAVCDGYSSAYLYLLQQAGIEASMIYGYGGADEASGEPHAWNVVKLGNEWYEVDSTWDDMLDTFEKLRNDPELPEESIPFIELPLEDAACGDMMTHYMYNLTTSEIRHYKSSEDNWVIVGDQYVDFIGDSVHIRDSERMESANPYSLLMELAPTASGTKYK